MLYLSSNLPLALLLAHLDQEQYKSLHREHNLYIVVHQRLEV